jgi:hypothetical protein
MNAKQIKNQKESKCDLNLSLIAVEKTEQSTVWDRLRKFFESPDMSLEEWERIEMKRSRHSFTSNQWRNF